MIELRLKTPNPVEAEGDTEIIVNPGEVGAWDFDVRLKEGVKNPVEVKCVTTIPGPALNPECIIGPQHFQSDYPKWKLDGAVFNGRTGTFTLEPGVPKKLSIYIGLNDSCPWNGLLIVQIYPQPVQIQPPPV